MHIYHKKKHINSQSYTKRGNKYRVGLGGLPSFETSRLSHCLDHRVTVGGEVDRPPRFSTQKHLTKYLMIFLSVRS
jgi:hypothetical protein